MREQATAASQPACPAPTITMSNCSVNCTKFYFTGSFARGRSCRMRTLALAVREGWADEGVCLYAGRVAPDVLVLGASPSYLISVNTASCHLPEEKYQSLAPAS